MAPDVDTLHIDKHLQLKNVHFQSMGKGPSAGSLDQVSRLNGVWYKCRFTKMVEIEDCANFHLFNSRIENHFRLINNDFFLASILSAQLSENELEFQNNTVRKDFNIRSVWTEEFNRSIVSVNNNHFEIDEHQGSYAFSVTAGNALRLSINRNRIFTHAPNQVYLFSAQWVVIEDNQLDRMVYLDLNNLYGLRRLMVNRNSFSNYVLLNLPLEIPPSAFIEWKQFEGQLLSNNGYGPYVSDLFVTDRAYLEANRDKTHFLSKYYDSIRIIDSDAYVGEMALRGRLYNHHKAKYDYEAANQVFMDLKNLETKRLEFLYNQNPTFKTYFKWKINHFLKIFVDYGTEPAKAIVFAVYVIGFFALIYLFFPNSWDSHGRMRIMDRYRFFLKYINREEGASHVYLEEKEKELLPFHDFKTYLEENGKTAPRFFYLTGIPLYKWSISGSRLSSWLLSRVDVLKGKWSDIPPSGRWMKSTVVITSFSIALIYDLLIKVLNAVMLSINTFTTLGFGEIPIKGLPRYLAIIQGFIGWFMLTIFSVSLISQLLN